MTGPRGPTAGPRDDALLVARFIVGYWPGLGDGISWGGDTTQEPVYLAAQRILAAARDGPA